MVIKISTLSTVRYRIEMFVGDVAEKSRGPDPRLPALAGGEWDGGGDDNQNLVRTRIYFLQMLTPLMLHQFLLKCNRV